jgi:hypothetical protein
MLVVTGRGGCGGTGGEGGSSVPNGGGLGSADRRGGFEIRFASGTTTPAGASLTTSTTRPRLPQDSPSANTSRSAPLSSLPSPPISLLGLGLGFAS